MKLRSKNTAASKDVVTKIPKKDRIPELEAEVESYLSIIPQDDEKIDKKITRVIPPKFHGAEEEKAWRKSEIKKCKEGYKGLTGKNYFWINYVWIKNISGGKISPHFRVAQKKWWDALEREKDTEWGHVCVKRRRAGFSWLMAADALHDAMFSSHTNIGMNSKTERDSIELFKKVKFIYDNIPDWMRATSTAGNSKMHMDFSYFRKDKGGNRIKRGTQSNIVVVPPTDSAFEGWMLNRWVCDESGKIRNLAQMWSYTEDCLMEETVRLGTPILFGTCGDISKAGAGLKEMWDNYEAYKLRRFFYGGWMGIYTDEYGNDLVEEAVRWIVYERWRRRTLSEKAQKDFLQRYPLTIEEAFTLSESGGVGDQIKINSQIKELEANPVRGARGKFVEDDSKPNGVKFMVDPKGHAIVYEHPVGGIKNLYAAGCDPADHDIDEVTKNKELSDLSLMIRKRQNGAESPHLVFEMTYRPSMVSDFYYQAYLALRYYNGTKVLVERNRYRFISYFKENGFAYLLAYAPQGIMKMIGGKTNTMGITMTPSVKEYIEGLIEEDVDHGCELIPSTELLQEFKVWGIENTDRAIAYGLALMQEKEMAKVRQRIVEGKENKALPRFSYKRIGNKIVRVKENPIVRSVVD